MIGFACGSEEKSALVEVKSPWNDEEVAWFRTTGSGSIQGNAKFISKGGVTRFGKDFTVELQPYSKYTEERLTHIYHAERSGSVHVEDGVPKFTPDPEGYHATKKATCDAEGNFAFTDLPAGEYYLIAFMLWDETGGGLMQRVTLAENESVSIVMDNF